MRAVREQNFMDWVGNPLEREQTHLRLSAVHLQV